MVRVVVVCVCVCVWMIGSVDGGGVVKMGKRSVEKWWRKREEMVERFGG